MLKSNNYITIGVPVRNEAQMLEQFIDSLHEAIYFMSDDIEVETIICLNGTTDNSESVVDHLIDKYSKSRLNIKKIHSDCGKIVAQKAIIENTKLYGRICFIDADVSLDKSCLNNLWLALELNEDLQVAYAAVHPIYFERMTLVEKMQQSHYINRCLLSRRRYFHGRAFMLQSKKIFLDCLDGVNNCKYHLNKALTLSLHEGPKVDDIYMSRVIVHIYGLESIMEVVDAQVYFIPPRTFNDFYHGQKRMVMEIKRLDVLFPEHAYIQKKYFGRKVSWKKLFKLPLLNIYWYIAYLCFERMMQKVIRLRIFLAYLGIDNIGVTWVSLDSTKKIKEVKDEI